MKKKEILLLMTIPIVFLTLSFIIAGCGSDSSSSSNPFSSVLPALAVTSPTAATTATTASVFGRVRNTMWAGFEMVLGPVLRLVGINLAKSVHATNNMDAMKPYSDQVQEFQNMLGLDPAAHPPEVSFVIQGSTLTCYGSQKAIANNNDIVGGSGDLLYGDGGFVEADENGEACAAAALNNEVMKYAGLVNEGMKILAAILAQAQKEGEVVPADLGDSITVDEIPVPGLAGTATLSVIDPGGTLIDDGYTTFQVAISGTVEDTTNSISGSAELNLQHSVNGDNKRGIFGGVIPTPIANSYHAYSVLYNITATNATFLVKSMDISSAPGGSLPDCFGSDNQIDMDYNDGGANTNNITYFLSSIDPSTGLGDAIMVWNAGGNDPLARVFQVHTQAGTAGADTGYGYYGFGHNTSEANETSGDLGTITGTICLWQQGDNAYLANYDPNTPVDTSQPTFHADEVQAMRMQRDTTTGKFAVVAGQSAFAWCPTISCDGHAGLTVGGEACTAAKDLAAKNTYGTVSITAPSYP